MEAIGSVVKAFKQHISVLNKASRSLLTSTKKSVLTMLFNIK